MIFPIDAVLTSEELKLLTDKLNRADFVDGKTTAGWHAKLVKNNQQLDHQAPYIQELRAIVQVALKRHPLFQSAVLPKKIHTILFSAYQPGMSYGRHVDNALMGQEEFWRSDVSFTLFLSDPSTYTGGELVIEHSNGEQAYKLPAGSVLIYPSSTLHEVIPVKEGERRAVVGWVQSLVRNPDQREILFDLDTVRRSVFSEKGKTLEFDLLSKSYANLLRMWAE